MIKMYRTDMLTNKTSKTTEFEKGTWINMVAPTEQEIRLVCENLKIQEDFIRDSLDFEERARIDYEEDDNTTLFIVDVPIIEQDNDNQIRTTMPIGMIVVRDDFFITVSLKENRIIKEIEDSIQKKSIITYKKSRMILQIFYKNAEVYLSELKNLDKDKDKAEKELNTSLKNKELLKMLELEKSLVYFTTSLKSNEVVMEKTLRGKIIKLYDEDEDLLEDAIIENKQAIEMAKIYSDILSGTMDAYASIISNNLNIVMKVLTVITIILSVPTIIGGFWGMNVKVPLESTAFGFYIIVGMTLVITAITYVVFKKRNLLS